MGHEIVALVAIRAPEGRYGADYPFALHGAAPNADLLFVRSGERIGALLRAYAPDVALCGSFPARIPDDALRNAFPWDEYELARSLVENHVPEGEMERDLFAGIR